MNGRALFRDRVDAGRRLAQALKDLAGRPNVVVLGLPRGGVPVAAEVARALSATLDVFVVRKLGVPGHEELAMGAIAAGGVRVLVPEIIRALGIRDADLEEVTAVEQRELERRARAYHGDATAAPRAQGATVVLVDDGIATGATMQAAVAAARRLGAGAVIVAAPVMSHDAVQRLAATADRVVCLAAPDDFISVGGYYLDFRQTTDDEVRRLLTSGGAEAPISPRGSAVPGPGDRQR